MRTRLVEAEQKGQLLALTKRQMDPEIEEGMEHQYLEHKGQEIHFPPSIQQAWTTRNVFA
jgi:hypothetical protein